MHFAQLKGKKPNSLCKVEHTTNYSLIHTGVEERLVTPCGKETTKTPNLTMYPPHNHTAVGERAKLSFIKESGGVAVGADITLYIQITWLQRIAWP